MVKHLSLLLGNFLEFYEFTLFAYLLPLIATIIFPAKTPVDAIISGYLFLAIGFLSRPIGAVLFGYIGDYYGRRKAMIISILMMSLSTIMISALPTKHDTLFLSLVLLAGCRILQGLSAGGEYSGAGLLLIENNNNNPYLKGAILTTSGLMGAFVASIAAACISLNIFPSYSWRFLFFIGGVLGLLGLWLRLQFVDNEINMAIQKKIYLRKLFFEYRWQFLCTIFIGGLMNVPFQLVTGFINTYFISLGAYDKTTLMFINAGVILFCAFVTIFFGYLTHYFNALKMMLVASLGMCLFAFPFFFLIESNNFLLFIFAELILIFLSQLFVAPAFTTISKLFPHEIRFRGVAIGNCLGIAMFGGVTPYISAFLITNTGISWAPAFYLLLVSLLGFFSVILIQFKLDIKSLIFQKVGVYE